MKRKFLNILVIIFIVFISMFASKKVEATEGNEVNEMYKCAYISPMSYITNTSDGVLAVDSKITLNYIRPYYKGGFLPYGYGNEHRTKTVTIDAFCVIQGGYNTLGIKSREFVEESSNVKGVNIKVNQSIFAIDTDSEYGNWNGYYDYVKLTVNSDGSYSSIKYATEDEYKNYVQENQYKNYVSTQKGKIFYPLSFDTIEANYFFSNYNCILKCDMYGISIFESGNGINNIANFIKNTGGVVFVNTKRKSTYSTKEYNTFKSYIETAKYNGKALTSEDQQQCLDGLSVVIDTSNVDTIHYTKAFYDGTKQMWLKYIQDDLKNPKLGDSQRKEIFSRWFDRSIARYMFEDDISAFINVYKYIYGTCDGTSGNTCNLDVDGDGKSGTNDDIDTYKKMISILENMHHADKTTECKLNLSNDPCESVCSASGECPNYTALEECKKGSADYAACTKCTPDCNTKCEKVGDETSKQQCKKVCYDECTNGKYSKARDSYDETIQKDKDAIAEAAKYIYGLSRVSAPSLDINFDKHYELTCDDVSFFHGFYVVIRILAPIAVVLFGTLDYAKAVLSADIDKLNKSKKSLPKRILLLILFLGVPFIVSFMVNLFGGDFSLMKCIINGE